MEQGGRGMEIAGLTLWERVALLRQLLNSIGVAPELEHLRRKISNLNSELLAAQIAAKKLKF